jgi:hypothetical protein
VVDRGIAEVKSQITEVNPFDFNRELETLLLQFELICPMSKTIHQQTSKARGSNQSTNRFSMLRTLASTPSSLLHPTPVALTAATDSRWE